MNVLQKFWAILLGLVQRGMSKFRVIYQIGLIILVMAFFLGVQGMMALNTFNKMQTVTQNVFSCSIKGFLSTASIRQEMAYIQNQYTQSLLDNRPLTVTFDNVETAIQALKADSAAGSDAGFTSIENQVAEIKKLLASPVSKENYQKLNQSADLVAMNIKSFESTLNLNAISSMERGNEFFRNSRNTNILLLIISLALSIVMGSTVAALIAKPLKEMVAVAGLLAAGDFTRVLKVKGNLEINQLVDGLNYAIGSLRTLVANINEQAKNLAIAGRELNDASHESGKSASEVARAMESMALSTAEQTDQINQTANTMNTLGKLVEKVSGDSLNIAQTSEKVAAAAQNGQQIASNVAVRMNEVYRSTKEVNEVIGDMSRDSEQIREIAALIGGIAEQTSLLALNAAIEAARAGIHGRGFSVVAEETGKLADQSKQASLKIDSLVNEMMSRNKQATEAIGKGVDEVEKGKLLTSVATTTFESIFQEIEAMLSQINIVAKSAQQMANGNEKVIEAITSVAAISEEGMATTEEISATVEEQSASAEQVAALAGNLLQIAENMKRSVGTFRF